MPGNNASCFGKKPTWFLTIETLTFLHGRVHLTLNQNSRCSNSKYDSIGFKLKLDKHKSEY